MASGQSRHQRPVFDSRFGIRRDAAEELFIGGDGFIDLSGHAEQARLLQLLLSFVSR